MNARDMLAATARKATETLDLEIDTEDAEEDLWLKVDSYAIISALAFVHKQLAEVTGSRRFTHKVTREGRFACFDIVWEGKSIRPDKLRKWEDQVVTFDQQALSSTLKEVIEQHAAEIWSHAYKESQLAYLRLLFPVAESVENGRIRNLTILPKSRPEFFDFDLFSQPGQRPELDHRLLSDLTYTVFDTETTGLDPQGGDEIISIGAVRIVNNRILREECFDQLVNPRRRIPEESIRIHGILPEMVAEQPSIEKALPLFFHFTEDTILVAHNAAFDMRMLQLKEGLSGVRFTNPVLDTMLLSAVVQPGQENHDMEGIAARLGISIVGRHTALGDALVTAEIFLKLIPLLEKQGITTLGQARKASQKTYHARMKY
jgi:DNA polymerase-3 subunit epsilon